MGTDVIGPFELYGEVLISVVVGLDALDDGKSGKVLEEDDGSFGCKTHGVADDG